MAKLVSAKCPECGARLKVNPAESEAKCEYCGVVSPIQVGRTQAVEAMNPGDSSVVQPNQHTIQISGQYRWMWLIYILVPLVIFMAGGGAAVFNFMRTKNPDTGQGGLTSMLGHVGQQTGQERIGWHGGEQAILLDVNGDGVSDPVGRVRKLVISSGAHTEHLAAYNAVDGKLLWISDPLAEVSQGHLLRVTLVGDVLLVADHMGMLKAYAPNNGQLKWTATVGERVKIVCGAGPGKARLETTDKRVVFVAVATGQLSPEKAGDDAPCQGGWSTDIGRGTALVERMGGPFYSGEPLPEIKGMNVEFTFREIATGISIAVGQKESGTLVPMAARYNKVKLTEKETAKLKKWRQKVKTTPTWLTNVAAVNPLSVYADGPKTAAIVAGRAIIPYRMQDSKQGWRLACLDVNSGKNLWDVPVPNLGRGVEAVVASDRQLFISTWDGLHLFELADGAHRVTVASMK
jgi:outer membrane protein assembly factor BamB